MKVVFVTALNILLIKDTKDVNTNDCHYQWIYRHHVYKYILGKEILKISPIFQRLLDENGNKKVELAGGYLKFCLYYARKKDDDISKVGIKGTIHMPKLVGHYTFMLRIKV
ncbi:MAG: hypothetical protein ACI936_002163 [Paraglaciecola sp.]|jgi:hypothetical protein